MWKARSEEEYPAVVHTSPHPRCSLPNNAAVCYTVYERSDCVQHSGDAFLWLLGCRGSNWKKHSKLCSRLAMTHYKQLWLICCLNSLTYCELKKQFKTALLVLRWVFWQWNCTENTLWDNIASAGEGTKQWTKKIYLDWQFTVRQAGLRHRGQYSLIWLFTSFYDCMHLACYWTENPYLYKTESLCAAYFI